MSRSLPKPQWRRDFIDGTTQGLPFVISVVPFALLYGALAAQAGMRPLETFLTSALVFAGSAQFVALELWREPLPILSLVLTTGMVNLRHLLMGAAMAPGLTSQDARAWTRARTYGALFLMADEIWALAMRRLAAGPLTPAFYAGLALPLYLAFLSFSTLGNLAGTLLEDPARFGFDFAFSAVFLVLLSSLWRGRTSLWPWALSGLAAVTCYSLLPGVWYIFAGGLAGALTGALLGAPRANSGGPNHVA